MPKSDGDVERNCVAGHIWGDRIKYGKPATSTSATGDDPDDPDDSKSSKFSKPRPKSKPKK